MFPGAAASRSCRWRSPPTASEDRNSAALRSRSATMPLAFATHGERGSQRLPPPLVLQCPYELAFATHGERGSQLHGAAGGRGRLPAGVRHPRRARIATFTGSPRTAPRPGCWRSPPTASEDRNGESGPAISEQVRDLALATHGERGSQPPVFPHCPGGQPAGARHPRRARIATFSCRAGAVLAAAGARHPRRARIATSTPAASWPGSIELALATHGERGSQRRTK